MAYIGRSASPLSEKSDASRDDENKEALSVISLSSNESVNPELIKCRQHQYKIKKHYSQDNQQKTAKMYAEYNGHSSLVELLNK